MADVQDAAGTALRQMQDLAMVSRPVVARVPFTGDDPVLLVRFGIGALRYHRAERP